MSGTIDYTKYSAAGTPAQLADCQAAMQQCDDTIHRVGPSPIAGYDYFLDATADEKYLSYASNPPSPNVRAEAAQTAAYNVIWTEYFHPLQVSRVRLPSTFYKTWRQSFYNGFVDDVLMNVLGLPALKNGGL